MKKILKKRNFFSGSRKTPSSARCLSTASPKHGACRRRAVHVCRAGGKFCRKIFAGGADCLETARAYPQQDKDTAHAAGERCMSAARGKFCRKIIAGWRSLSCINKGTVFVMKHRSLNFIPLPCIVVIHSGSCLIAIRLKIQTKSSHKLDCYKKFSICF